MVTVSLCMVVRDEAHVLARCLDGVRDLTDEIVIVDTGSRDNTREVAQRYTARVPDFPWIDDFSAARNFSFTQATGDYIFWLDADDILLEEDRIRFRSMCETLDPSVDIVMLPHHIAFDAEGKPIETVRRERLIRREAGLRWEGVVRERIVPCGKVIDGDAAVTHLRMRPRDPNRDLRILERQLARGRRLTPREQYVYGRELRDHGRFGEAIDCLRQLLDEGHGDAEDCIAACQVQADCYDHLGLPDMALRALLRSMTFDMPRAEICCALGARFVEKGECAQAAFWYETALRCPCPTGGYCSPECRGFLPYVRLCMCYRQMGDDQTAEKYLRKARKMRPHDEAVRYYGAYFRAVRAKQKKQS